MVDERLQLEGESGRYHAVHASQHLARYHVLRDKCRGKRVLDAACGVGFGSYLIAEWGAKEVLGVDIAPEAIASARRNFAHDRIRFIQHDIEDLCNLLAGEGQFDVLACFETIEHLRNPSKFLAAAAGVLAPSAIIVVSCPNDKCALRPEQENPYHLSGYTFAQFCSLTTEYFGRASQWMIGTPVNGTVAIDLTDGRAREAAQGMRDIVNYAILNDVALMPWQSNVAPTVETCLFYLGVWGDTLPATVAISPTSYARFIEPWWLIESQQKQLVASAEHVQAANADLASSRNELERAQAATAVMAVEHASELERARARLHHLERDLANAHERQQLLESDLISTRAEMANQSDNARKAEASVRYNLASLRTKLAEQEAANIKQLDFSYRQSQTIFAQRREIDRLSHTLDIIQARYKATSFVQEERRRRELLALPALRREREELDSYRRLVRPSRWSLGHLRQRIFRIRSPRPSPLEPGYPFEAAELSSSEEDRLLVTDRASLTPAGIWSAIRTSSAWIHSSTICSMAGRRAANRGPHSNHPGMSGRIPTRNTAPATRSYTSSDTALRWAGRHLTLRRCRQSNRPCVMLLSLNRTSQA